MYVLPVVEFYLATLDYFSHHQWPSCITEPSVGYILKWSLHVLCVLLRLKDLCKGIGNHLVNYIWSYMPVLYRIPMIICIWPWYGFLAAPGPGAIPPPPQPTTLSTPDEVSGAGVTAATVTTGWMKNYIALSYIKIHDGWDLCNRHLSNDSLSWQGGFWRL